MRRVAVTVDLDWACEAAIEALLDALDERRISPTVFVTHRSARVEAAFEEIEVGLHPFFGEGSSHGASVDEVVRHVLDLPHNLPAFRCHRFAVSNTSREALVAAGMRISSNVCTDLEEVRPFRERCGLVEVPIFFEDGGYLARGHSLDRAPDHGGDVVVLVHPMHFAINTPNFDYMRDIKRSVTREAWRGLTGDDLRRLRWQGRGVRDLVLDLLDRAAGFTTLGELAHARMSRA